MKEHPRPSEEAWNPGTLPDARSLRIILGTGSLEIGGTERQVVRLAVELQGRGHEVTVLVLTRAGALATDLESAGVPVWELGLERELSRSATGRIRMRGLLRLWRRWFGLVRALRRRRPDVVHAFLFWSYVLLLPAARLARVRLRISGRRNMGTEKWAHRLYPLVERAADACSHLVVANAEAIAEVVGAGVPKRKIRVIPNGVDLGTPPHAVGRQPARGVMIANLISYKGHEDLLRALSLMLDPPDIDLYGDGPERARVEELVAALGLRGTVRLHGRIPEAARYYHDAQFAVLASHEEGMPNAILEAMAVGLPVVATAVGGVPEVVRNGHTGVLVPPHRPAELAAGIARLAGDPQLRVTMGRTGREMVATTYSWERCVRAHEALYRAG
jgi:glycosyltransferase involved in cell wall biosynthesis